MSRKRDYIRHLVLRFPRASGDEPSMSIGFELIESFSPRERG